MTTASNEVPIWFDRQIRRGLAALMTLRLEGHPAADTIDMTAKVWAQALYPNRQWNQKTDVARLGEAFRRLASTKERWPAPVELVRRLPPPPDLPTLPQRQWTEDERDTTMRNLARLKEEIRRGLCMQHD